MEVLRLLVAKKTRVKKLVRKIFFCRDLPPREGSHLRGGCDRAILFLLGNVVKTADSVDSVPKRLGRTTCPLFPDESHKRRLWVVFRDSARSSQHQKCRSLVVRGGGGKEVGISQPQPAQHATAVKERRDFQAGDRWHAQTRARAGDSRPFP